MGPRGDPGERGIRPTPEVPNDPKASSSSEVEVMLDFFEKAYPPRPNPGAGVSSTLDVDSTHDPELETEPSLELQASEDDYNNWR